MYRTHHDMSLWSNGVDWVRSSRKTPTCLRGTNFCTSSKHFAPSFVRQLMVINARKWYETHQNMCLGSNGVDRVRSSQKTLTRLRGTNFCTSSARFAPSFVRQPNCPKCAQIVRNAPKRQFRVQWGGSGAFIAKNSDATSWHELFCTSSARFAPSSVRKPNGLKCTQIVRNALKYQFTVL